MSTPSETKSGNYLRQLDVGACRVLPGAWALRDPVVSGRFLGAGINTTRIVTGESGRTGTAIRESSQLVIMNDQNSCFHLNREPMEGGEGSWRTLSCRALGVGFGLKLLH